MPPGEDLNEWLAVNTVDFYNAISVLFGTLEEFCTCSTCPVMSAGPKVIIYPSLMHRTAGSLSTQLGHAQYSCHQLGRGKAAAVTMYYKDA